MLQTDGSARRESAVEPRVARIGAVVIGRNEGDRLRKCLASLAGRAAPVIYVDSGSTDGSVELARQAGAEVVILPSNEPFTAARGRNAGIDRILNAAPDLAFVQLVDGDCEMIDGWLDRAVETLDGNPELAAVCGRRRERFPERSIYNRVLDLEWDAPKGVVPSVGGDSLFRAEALRQEKFDPWFVAREEPELCLRLRRRGWKIMRIAADMAWHDAELTRFRPWWRRTVRNAIGYAQNVDIHGREPEHFCVRETRSNLFWGGVLPIVMLAFAAAGFFLHPLWFGLLIGGLYFVLAFRVYRHKRRQNVPPSQAAMYAWLTVVGKFACARGWLKYRMDRRLGRRDMMVEYKNT